MVGESGGDRTLKENTLIKIDQFKLKLTKCGEIISAATSIGYPAQRLINKRSVDVGDNTLQSRDILISSHSHVINTNNTPDLFVL